MNSGVFEVEVGTGSYFEAEFSQKQLGILLLRKQGWTWHK
jgi:hypothetical protein